MAGTIVRTLTFQGLLSTLVNIVTKGLRATFITRNTNQISIESTELNCLNSTFRSFRCEQSQRFVPVCQQRGIGISVPAL